MRTHKRLTFTTTAILLIAFQSLAGFDLFRGRVNTLWNRASTFTALTNRPAGDTPGVWTPPFLNVGGGTDGDIYSITTQPTDGKAVIGGNFTVYNGTPRKNIARVNTDGSLDTSFSIGSGFNDNVYSVAVQTDGKIVVVGLFTTYNGTTRNRIARLNTDGTLDASFDPLAGFNATAHSLVIQTDGKFMVTGNFATYNGTTRNRVIRINTDGSIDLSFDPGTGPDVMPSALVQQTDGKIILVGSFNFYNGTARARVVRINTDGLIDLSFDPGSGFNNPAYSCALQSDGKVIIVGDFTTYNGTGRNRAVRVHTDGAIDLSFDPGAGANNLIQTCKVQSDGKVIIGGNFTSYGGTGRNNIARVNSDGSIDSTFDPGSGCDQRVYATVIQSDSKVLLGGQFTTVNGVSYLRYTRLKSNGSLDN